MSTPYSIDGDEAFVFSSQASSTILHFNISMSYLQCRKLKILVNIAGVAIIIQKQTEWCRYYRNQNAASLIAISQLIITVVICSHFAASSFWLIRCFLCWCLCFKVFERHNSSLITLWFFPLLACSCMCTLLLLGLSCLNWFWVQFQVPCAGTGSGVHAIFHLVKPASVCPMLGT